MAPERNDGWAQGAFIEKLHAWQKEEYESRDELRRNLEDKIEDLRKELKDELKVNPGREESCKEHLNRVKKLEESETKLKLLAALFGTLGAGVAWIISRLVNGGS